MLRIAICDDDEIAVRTLTDKILNYNHFDDPDFELKPFLAGDRFLNSHKQAPFDVVFLDINMPEMSGFDIAEQINKYSEALIVFVTAHDELVYSSIKFRPFRFIRKAYLDTELPEALAAVNEELIKRNAERKFIFQTKAGEVFVDLARVEYIEIYSHRLMVHLIDNEVLQCCGSLSGLEQKLCSHSFVRTHKSYIVNCKYIYSFEKNRLLLDDRTAIPVSRYKYESVKEKYRNYLRRTI